MWSTHGSPEARDPPAQTKRPAPRRKATALAEDMGAGGDRGMVGERYPVDPSFLGTQGHFLF